MVASELRISCDGLTWFSDKLGRFFRSYKAPLLEKVCFPVAAVSGTEVPQVVNLVRLLLSLLLCRENEPHGAHVEVRRQLGVFSLSFSVGPRDQT